MKTTHFRNKLNEDEQHYNGLGSPQATFEHQAYITHLLENVNYVIRQKHNLIVAPEAEVAGPNSLAPDILVRHKTTKKPVFIIEIELSKHLKRLINKIQKKLLLKYPSIKEALIFLYDTKEWLKVTKHNVKPATKSTFLNRSLKRMATISYHNEALKRKEAEIKRLKALLKKQNK